MTKKKSKFLTFCFACIPGAGQMFLGFMKRGVSLMTIFFGIILLSSTLHLEEGIFLIPIIWFFAFFDTLNINGLSDEEFATVTDDFLFVQENNYSRLTSLVKYKTIFAILFILIGIRLLLDNCLHILNRLGFDMSWEVSNVIFDIIPQIVIAVLIILFGIYLIRGKKQALDAEEINMLDTIDKKEEEDYE